MQPVVTVMQHQNQNPILVQCRIIYSTVTHTYVDSDQRSWTRIGYAGQLQFVYPIMHVIFAYTESRLVASFVEVVHPSLESVTATHV